MVEQARHDPEVKEQVEAQEAASFGAFMGAFQQTQAATGGGA